jgi:hypothetical protein
MSGNTLTTASTLTCPHGGKVTITPTGPRASADRAPMATTADLFAIAGCAFALPGPVPSPCVRVQWIIPGMKVSSGGGRALYTDSVGQCVAATGAPQGPVTVLMTQSKVSGR